MLRATRSNSSKKIPRSLGIGERQGSAILASARGSRKLTAKRIKSVPFDDIRMEAAAEELKGPEAEVDENGDKRKQPRRMNLHHQLEKFRWKGILMMVELGGMTIRLIKKKVSC